MGITNSTNASTQEAKEELKPWIRRLARIGYMARGLVFVMVGILTFMAAVGVGGNASGTQGMFRSLAGMPFGEILLWLIAIGLLLYEMWLFIKVIKAPQNKGKGWKELFSRGASLVIAIIYGGLIYSAFSIALHAGSSSGNTEKTWSAKLLSQPFGQWLIAGLGIAIIVYGILELCKGITTKFMKRFHTEDMSAHEYKIAKNAGRLGLVSRGAVFGMIGFFFIKTAWTSDSDQAKGLDGVLSELSQEPYGQIILAIAAIGLFLYGVYQIARGRYQHMGLGKY
ncbi:DUF1206 domain-containing protein [Aquibacillus koreensis]|uniref:DUF1206 domain-containing protein n=1 Tax=Aquibacillus koreensis TaxID=279446 RepID=A0A9X3WH64_9BACI|nr:DUF1206 domain-containing protein [Aquibacillus koreensis]MCT2534703.1 DUF1206 domain-containing protein [Aquibacillus koreensis]MDC3419687.1 DUF1206 domain-containing protein [Aquibacillus koreensis]